MFSKKCCKISIRLEEELDNPLREISERFQVSEAFMIRRFIKAGIESQDKHRLILSDKGSLEHPWDGRERRRASC